MITKLDLHPDAIGLRLIRFSGTKTYFCEPVTFTKGRSAVDTVLRRASIAGRVEIEGKVENHQADVLIGKDGVWEGEWDQVVALDADSYRSLKNHWMRCRVEAIE